MGQMLPYVKWGLILKLWLFPEAARVPISIDMKFLFQEKKETVQALGRIWVPSFIIWVWKPQTFQEIHPQQRMARRFSSHHGRSKSPNIEILR